MIWLIISTVLTTTMATDTVDASGLDPCDLIHEMWNQAPATRFPGMPSRSQEFDYEQFDGQPNLLVAEVQKYQQEAKNK